MGLISSKNAKHNKTNDSNGSNDLQDYSKEVAAYQLAVYGNNQPSKQLLKQMNINTNNKQLHHDEEKGAIQSDYANCISVLNCFWASNVNTLSDDEYESLALQFYTNVFQAIPEAQPLFLSAKKDMNTQSKIFFGMFGWLVSTVSKPNSYNILLKIATLGKLHETMGVTLAYYLKMGATFHKTMSDEFKENYSLRIRFCFNTLYEIVVSIMIGQDFNSKIQKNKMEQLMDHINDLETCLNDEDALEYLHLFMKQLFCAELALYYKDFKIFKNFSDQTEKNKKGEEIKKLYIDKDSEREINISYDRKMEFAKRLKEKQNKYDDNTYDNITYDVIKLIRLNCYPKFVKQIKKVYDEINSSAQKITWSNNWNFLIHRFNQSVQKQNMNIK